MDQDGVLSVGLGGGGSAPVAPENTVLWSNRHRSFNSARGNKAFWPNGHLKRDATANTLISYGSSGIWWRLLHNTEYFASGLPPIGLAPNELVPNGFTTNGLFPRELSFRH